jgi:hypothetical protein
MYKLWNADMYVENLDDKAAVFVEKDDKKSFFEGFFEQVEEESYGFDTADFHYTSGLEWLWKTILSTICTGFMLFFSVFAFPF